MHGLCTCSSCWIGVAHVSRSRGWRPLVVSILRRRGWVRIAMWSRLRWPVAIHHSRWRIAVRGSTILSRSGARSWSERCNQWSLRFFFQMQDTINKISIVYKPFVASLKRCCPTSIAPPLVNDILKWAWPSQPPKSGGRRLIWNKIRILTSLKQTDTYHQAQLTLSL